jgi:competence protein ComEC
MNSFRLWVVISLFIMMGFIYWHYSTSNAKLIMCDVGQGDASILTRGFSQMIIDVGPDNGGSLECLGKVMPFWDKTIEVVTLTHTDADHIGALNAILSHYRVKNFMVTANEVNEIRSRLGDNAPIQVVGTGDVWRWAGFSGEVVWPDHNTSRVETNYGSLVQRITLSSQDSVWAGGDAPTEVESLLLARGSVTPTTIYKVSHHGSSSSTSQVFLAILQPRQAWISVGKHNRYGHPTRQVLDLLEEVGAQIRRTDLEGAISLPIPDR